MLEKYSEERIAKLQECGSIDIDLDLIVTPSEIDFLIDKLSIMIASSINNALHNRRK